MVSIRSVWPLIALGLFVVEPTPLGATEAEAVREAFAALDKDGDGKITREEFELYKVNVIFRRSGERGATLRFEDTLVSRATFDAIDVDGDGVITPSDVREASFFKFESFDRNEDNVIDIAEFQGLLATIGRGEASGSANR